MNIHMYIYVCEIWSGKTIFYVTKTVYVTLHNGNVFLPYQSKLDFKCEKMDEFEGDGVCVFVQGTVVVTQTI